MSRPLVLAALAAFAVGRAQAQGSPSACLGIPPEWESRVAYYQSFDGGDGGPEVNAAGLKPENGGEAAPSGARGRCVALGKGRSINLRGAALSPHRPIVISFWWALRSDGEKDTGVGLCSLNGKAGYVSVFSRTGPWCGLTRSAGVCQIYNLPGIQNVNGIYDTAWTDHVDVHSGVWHHQALVIEGGSLVTVYTDGRRVFQTRLIGRPLGADDAFDTLTIGGEGLLIDELIVLNRPASPAEIADYVTAIRQMRVAGYR